MLKNNNRKEVEYNNIPSKSFTIIAASRSVVERQVSLLTEAIVTVTDFAIVQVLEGLQSLIDEVSKSNRLTVTEAQLLLKMTRMAMLSRNNENIEMQFTYDELLHLRKWLEARISHCEKERDERITITLHDDRVRQKFNPDTYIGLKLFLLDIREAMLGEIL